MPARLTDAVTVLPFPPFASAKFAPLVVQVTFPTSPASTPDSEQFVIVAAVVPSYVLFAAVIVAVTVTAVMLAVVVAVVDDNT